MKQIINSNISFQCDFIKNIYNKIQNTYISIIQSNNKQLEGLQKCRCFIYLCLLMMLLLLIHPPQHARVMYIFCHEHSE